jgi:hypothetical protein
MTKAEEYLQEYVERIGKSIRGVDERTGHAIASMLGAYKNAIYSKAVKNADKSLSLLKKGGSPAVLSKAVIIVRNSSIKLAPMQKSMSSSYTWEGRAAGGVGSIGDAEIVECDFAPEDEECLALVLPQDEIKVPEEYNLDNALALCYAVALKSSPLDEQSLQEWVYAYVLTKISDYIGE